jgi:cytochrome c
VILKMNIPSTSPKSVAPYILGAILIASTLCVPKEAKAENEQLKKLMLANNCLACHQIDKRKYGPNFYEVAAKYGNTSSMIATLATKIKAGGTGVWGEDMMPPQAQVSDADAKTIAELVLALKPKE